MRQLSATKRFSEVATFMPVPALRESPKINEAGAGFSFLPQKDNKNMPIGTVPNSPEPSVPVQHGPSIKEDCVYTDVEISKMLCKDKPINKWRLYTIRQLMWTGKLKGVRGPDGTWIAYGLAIKNYLLRK